jgi:hypothetical protein
MTKVELEKEISNILGFLQDALDSIKQLKHEVDKAYNQLEDIDLTEDEDES